MNTEQQLRSALNAMLTQFGMDEDEWSKPTFDQARRALAAQPCPSQGCGGDGGDGNVALASKTAQVDVRAILEGQGVYLSTPTIDSIVRAALSTDKGDGGSKK